jgi:hypothetical protein
VVHLDDAKWQNQVKIWFYLTCFEARARQEGESEARRPCSWRLYVTKERPEYSLDVDKPPVDVH